MDCEKIRSKNTVKSVNMTDNVIGYISTLKISLLRRIHSYFIPINRFL